MRLQKLSHKQECVVKINFYPCKPIGVLLEKRLTDLLSLQEGICTLGKSLTVEVTYNMEYMMNQAEIKQDPGPQGPQGPQLRSDEHRNQLTKRLARLLHIARASFSHIVIKF